MDASQPSIGDVVPDLIQELIGMSDDSVEDAVALMRSALQMLDRAGQSMAAVYLQTSLDRIEPRSHSRDEPCVLRSE